MENIVTIFINRAAEDEGVLLLNLENRLVTFNVEYQLFKHQLMKHNK